MTGATAVPARAGLPPGRQDRTRRYSAQPLVGRLHALRTLAAGHPWLVASALVLAVAIGLVDFDRYYEWDEAVFASQSGGFLGVEAIPREMAASREVGPAVLAAALGAVGSGLSATRLLWALTSLGLVVLAFRSLQPVVGARAALTGFVAFTTSWSAMLYLGSIYGSLLGAAAALLTTGLYLQVLRAGPGDRWRRAGVALGLAAATAFWFRHVESLIVVLVLAVHAAAHWRTVARHTRALALAAATFLVGFVLPWLVDSTVRYGSPWERMAAARAQDYPRGLTSNVGSYLRLLGGDSSFPAYEPVPSWPRLALLCALVLAGALLLVAVRSRRSVSPVLLLLVLSAASAAFFLFYGGVVEDRYVLYGVIFLAAAAGTAVDAGLRVLEVRTDGRLVAGLLVGALVVWVGANAALVTPHERGRVLLGQQNALNAATIQTLAEGRPCQVFARYGAPALQIGSGCVASSVTDPDAAAASARAAVRAGAFVAVVWPGDAAPLGAEPGWDTVRRALPDGRLMTLRLSRPSPDTARGRP